MTTYQQQKQVALNLFEKAITFAQTQQNSDIAKHLQETQQHLAEGKLYVVVCGEYKQGKSSLINAFLEVNNLFPVDMDIATNLISTITYAQEEKITVLLGDIGQGKMQQIVREEIADYVTEQGNQGNAKKAKMLAIETPNPQLKEGLVLVDTPGTGSLNTEHTALTYAFIPNADVIIFVSDALSPLKTEELDFIKERIISHCRNLIFVVTKIDAIPDTETIIESNREKLAPILNCPPSEVRIVAVSSRAKQDYLKYKDPEDLEYSHFAELQEAIWTLANEQRGQILLLKALTELGRAITNIERPLKVEWQSYQQHSQAEIETGEQELKKTQKRLQELLQNNAEWTTRLKDGLEDIKSGMQEQFQNSFVQINRQATKYLDDDRLIANPQQIASLLEADIDGLMSDLSKQINIKAADLYTNLEAQSGLNFNPFSVSSLEREKALFGVEELQIKPSSMVEKAVSVGRTGSFNAGAGACLGGVVGALIGGAVGLLAGGVTAIPGAYYGATYGAMLGTMAGTTKGVVEGIRQLPKQEQTQAKQEISKILKQYIEDSQRLCFQALNKTVKALERFMRDELTSQLKRQKESYDRTLQSLQQARQLSQGQASQRSSQLKTTLEQIVQVQKEVEQLAIAVASPTGSRRTEADYGDWADE
jgi:predicted GTPase